MPLTSLNGSTELTSTCRAHTTEDFEVGRGKGTMDYRLRGIGYSDNDAIWDLRRRRNDDVVSRHSEPMTFVNVILYKNLT